MRRALGAWSASVLVALSLSACGGDAVKAVGGSTSEPSESVEPTATIPEPPATAPPTAPPTASSAAAGPTLDACEVVSAELISTDFGVNAGRSSSQPSSTGDPNSTDCFWFGGDGTVVVVATTRADQDLPESAYNYAGLAGAEPVPGADRGWIYPFPSQTGSTVAAGIILVRGQTGFNITLSTDAHPFTIETLQIFAQHVLDRIG